MKFRYYCRLRPPMPGAIPRKGLLSVQSFDQRQAARGLEYWGWAEYDRELDSKEIHEYELCESPDNPYMIED